MKTDQILLYGGGALAAYFLFLKPKTTTPVATTSVPGMTSTSGLVGINSGIRGGGGSFYTVSNYDQLLAANSNLGNPNYQLNSAELSQYLANYTDLQQGLPLWIGKKDLSGQLISSLTQAEQSHWTHYGCAEKRIFVPMQPPSSAAYIAPPANTQAASGSGSSWISSALPIATTLIGLLGEPDQLNNADCQALFTMSAIIKDILPLYAASDPILTRAMETRLNALLTQYS